MYITELVTIEEIEKWKENDLITISAGTGKGKSYFIKNNLYAIAKRDNKRILMLIHRRNCVNQFQMELEEANKHESGVLDIKTYQSIEAIRKKSGHYELDNYDYIICDEFHYFMSDAAFNIYTDLSLKAILESKTTKIFMSATGNYMKDFLNKTLKLKSIDYELPIDFNFIENLQFFYNDVTLEKYVEQAIRLNEKAVFFIQSATKAYELHQKFKDISIFNCSKSNKLYKHVDENQINDMLRNEGFDKSNRDGSKDSTEGKLVLITTTVMDAGVNLVMDDLRHIVCDVKDTGTMIQCVGRRRLTSKNDSFRVYVRAISNQQLGGIETQLRNRVRIAEDFIEYGEKHYVKENYRKAGDVMIYDEPSTELGDGTESKKKLNLLMYFKLKMDLLEIESIKKKGRSHPYMRYITEEVFNLSKYGSYEADKENMDLEEYLNSIVGEKLFKEEQSELIDKISLKDSRGRIQKGISLLNEYFKENKMSFLIVSKRKVLTIDNKKKRTTYWEIINDINN